jgi:hypothetical protein
MIKFPKEIPVVLFFTERLLNQRSSYYEFYYGAASISREVSFTKSFTFHPTVFWRDEKTQAETLQTLSRQKGPSPTT